MSRRMLTLITTLLVVFSLVGPAVATASTPTAGESTAGERQATFEAETATVVKEDPLKGAEDGLFLIRFDEEPAATYRGTEPGLRATSLEVSGARKFESKSPAVEAYTTYLRGVQAERITGIEGLLGRSLDVRFTYVYGNNGIAAEMTVAEARQVLRSPGVKFVQADFERVLETDVGPAFIGADTVWGTNCDGFCGEGMIVGIIDTGINPTNPSFADVDANGFDHTNPFGAGNYVGVCDSSNTGGDDHKAYDAGFPCNDKLIGAWGFTSVDAGNGAVSPWDYDGHGSHTASTVAGNVTLATINGNDGVISEDLTISGVAPRANIIAYAACCTGSALTAAIDQAIADGVDVINYSIGSAGASSLWEDFDTVGYLAARDAGIFVATSAGNSGPDPDTVGSPADAPWLTSVGASTHNRAYPNTLTVTAAGQTDLVIVGAGYTSGLTGAPIVYAGDFGDALCLEPFAAGTWTAGEIVICDRGEIARVEKGQNVLAGGAGGFVLANDVANGDSLVGDAHYLPGVHITYDDGVVLKAFVAANPSATADISGAVRDLSPSNGDKMAAFSSRGANRAIDIVSPSVTAPGVDIIAADGADLTGSGVISWGFNSGTSMASPHVAGAGALIMGQTSWTPAEIQSAMMLSAVRSVVKEDGVTQADPFDMGSGRVDVAAALAVPFVLNETTAKYEAADPTLGGDPRTLNLASMANSQCVLECEWTRTLKSTGAGVFDLTVVTDSDMVLGVTPSQITFTGAGETVDVTVTADVTASATGTWMFGWLEFSPVVVTAAATTADIAMPIAVQSTRGDLPSSVSITTGRDAGSYVVQGLTAITITDFTSIIGGLTLGETTDMSLALDATNEDAFDNVNDGTVGVINFTVASGSNRVVVEVVESEAPDIDLFVGIDTNGDGLPSEDEIVCQSATGTALEYCSLLSPDGGNYWAVVQNWESSAEGASDAVSVAVAVVQGDEGNMDVYGPASQGALDPFDVTIVFDEPAMAAGDHWYGSFSVGTDPDNPSAVGVVPVDVARVRDDVEKTASKTIAANGTEVTYTITVNSNITSKDLSYDLTDVIPEGMTYVEGSVTGGATVEDGVLSWSGVMPTSAGVAGSYEFTTSATDPYCDTGFGGYVNLADFGIAPDGSIVGDTTLFAAFETGDPFNFYGVDYTGVGFSDDGFIVFGNGYAGSPWLPQAVPDTTAPNNLAAITWFDGELFASGTSGTTLATAGPNTAIIEFDGVQLWSGSDPIMDMQVVISRSVSDDQGAYELVYAFNNVDDTMVAAMGPVTIGTENADASSGQAFLNLASASGVISNDLVVCANYVPAPDFPPAVITYDVMVDDDAEGIITNTVSHVNNAPGAKTEEASVDVGLVGVFEDILGNIFANDIIWLTEQGITQGCTTDGTQFCPEDNLTRGQMAAMLNRALDLPSSSTDQFTDDDFSIFENDINALAAAGITFGCNAEGTNFCPDDNITRGELAAMLDRALTLPDATDDYFTDDDASIFETSIDRLREANITFGCNPPDNDNFCPDGLVTRAQIAAFLHRALGE